MPLNIDVFFKKYDIENASNIRSFFYFLVEKSNTNILAFNDAYIQTKVIMSYKDPQLFSLHFSFSGHELSFKNNTASFNYQYPESYHNDSKIITFSFPRNQYAAFSIVDIIYEIKPCDITIAQCLKRVNQKNLYWIKDLIDTNTITEYYKNINKIINNLNQHLNFKSDLSPEILKSYFENKTLNQLDVESIQNEINLKYDDSLYLLQDIRKLKELS